MKFHPGMIAVLGLVWASTAHADAVPSELTTSLGTGPETDFRIVPQFGLRAEATFQTIEHAVLIGELTGTGASRLASATAMADVFPFKRGFHASLGVRFYGNRASAILRAAPGARYMAGSKLYSAALLRLPGANPGLAAVTPVLTMGYAARFSRNLSFGVEAGALFRGSRNGPAPTACSEAPCSAAMAALEAERAGMSRDIGRLKPFPLAQVRLGLRF